MRQLIPVCARLTLILMLLSVQLALFDQTTQHIATAAPKIEPANLKTSPTQSVQSENDSYGKLPLSFEANQGQIDPAVKFLAHGNGYSLAFTSKEAVLNVSGGSAQLNGKFQAGQTTNELHLALDGGNPAPVIEGQNLLPGKANYFIGQDANQWHTDIPTYAQVIYHEVYPGIDMRYQGTPGKLEYEFDVAPGADLGQIKMKVSGVNLELDKQGQLLLHSGDGDLKQGRPDLYQLQNGLRAKAASDVKTRYVLNGNTLGFDITGYDRTKPLVIAPVLLYGTYFGGGKPTMGDGIATDSGGNVYIVGTTPGGVVTTSGSYQPEYGTGGSKVFVAKLKPDGSGLIYCTYIGDGGNVASGLALDNAGNVVITGYSAGHYPTTAGAFQTHFSGGGSFPVNAFVTKLNSAGTSLIYSTFLGGNNGDQANALALDSTGNVFVMGVTSSSNFPTTPGVFQSSLNGGSDVFVTKLNVTGTGLLYSTYLGGTGNDIGKGLAIDSSGNAYVTGSAGGSGFPTTAGAYRTSLGSIFVSKINPSGTGLVYSTFIGNLTASNTALSSVYSVAVDPAGNAAITGITNDTQYPITPNAYQNSNLHCVDIGDCYGESDGFITEFNAGGTGLLYSSYLPMPSISLSNVGDIKSDSTGNFVVALDNIVLVVKPSLSGPASVVILSGVLGAANSTALFLDNSGNVYLTGISTSNDFQTTPGAYNAPSTPYYFGNGAIIVKANLASKSQVWAAFIGGSSSDMVSGVAVDSLGQAFVVGTTFGGIPATTSNLQLFYDPNASQVFVSKLNSTGTALLYSSYLGDGSFNYGNAIAVDSGGNAYLTGDDGGNIPITQGAFQTQPGGNGDSFVTKLNPYGDKLVYSSLLGGNGADHTSSLAIDGAGDAYVAGTVYTSPFSSNVPTVFPTTAGAFQTTVRGENDAFVVKVNPAGSKLIYSTLLGGNDGANCIAVDNSGNAYVVGGTSADFPTTPGAFMPTFRGGRVDGFVTKLNPSGTGLVYSTFLGAGQDDGVNSIAIDSYGQVFVTGSTNSPFFPVTPGSYQTTNTGNPGVFVSKLNANGSGLLYSTFLAGLFYSSGQAIKVGNDGSAYVAGEANTDFPTTPGALQGDSGNGLDNVGFVSKISPDGKALLYSTHLGYDSSNLAIDMNSNVYVVGASNSNVPTTPGTLQPAEASVSGGFVVKLGLGNAGGYTYFLPTLANQANGFTTYIAVQNTGTATANLQFQFYDPSGQLLDASSAASACANLAVNAECVPPTPFTQGNKGSATLISSQPLQIIVAENTPEGNTAYPAITRNNTNFLKIPVAINKALGGFSTQITVYNPSDSLISAGVNFINQDGSFVTTQNINLRPHASISFDQAATDSKLPANFYGWASISANYTSIKLVAQVLEQNTNNHFVAVANAQSNDSVHLYAPAIFNGAFGGFVTGANIVNPYPGAVNVSITYYDQNGRSYPAAPFSLAGSSVKTIYHGASSGPGLPVGGLPVGFYGSAIVNIDSFSGYGVVMLVNELGPALASSGSQSGTYTAAVTGSAVTNLPAIAKGGFGYNTGLTIQNITGEKVSGTIQYYNLDGSTVGLTQSFIVNPYSSQPFYQGAVPVLPDNFYGTAKISVTNGPTTSLIVTTNAISPTSFYTYTEPGD